MDNDFPCRHCNRTVIWARTDSGRNILIDAEAMADGDVALVSNTGRMKVRHVRRGEKIEEGTERYWCHFATCPRRDPFTSLLKER